MHRLDQLKTEENQIRKLKILKNIGTCVSAFKNFHSIIYSWNNLDGSSRHSNL